MPAGGVLTGQSTKLVAPFPGAFQYGKVAPYSVVVPGSLAGGVGDDGIARPSLYCAVILKQVDERTRSKTSINELLRD